MMTRHRGLVFMAALTGFTLGVQAEEVPRREEMVVTATLSARESSSSPAFTSVITAEDIEKAPVNGLADLLRESVGISNQVDTSGRDNIQIRGLDGSYTLILVDGKRVSSSGGLWRGGDFDYSSIPLASIERVEIVRGPMAALYGSDAIGGVINIITRYPSEAWQGAITAEYRVIDGGDEGEQRRLGMSAAGALSERVALTVSGEIYERDPWYRNSASDPSESPSLEEKKAENLVSTLRIKLNDAQRVDLDFGYNLDKRPYAMYSSGSYRNQEIERFSYGVSHHGSWSWGNTMVFYKQEDGEIEDYNSRYTVPRFREITEKNEYFKAYANAESGKHAWLAGVEYRNQLIEDPVSYQQTGEAETEEQALFAQDEISLTEKLVLTLGGRLDDHEVFGDHFSPKAYLTHKLSDRIVVKGGISKAFKAPGAYQLAPEYRIVSCGGSCFLAGNPNLEPESSVNYEVGVEINEVRWHLTAVLFQNEVEDMIVATYDAATNTRAWANVEEAETQGVELEGGVQLSPSLELIANLTLLDTERKDTSGNTEQIDNTPERNALISANWQMTDRLRGSLSVNHIGKQRYNSDDLPSYNRVDVTTAWEMSDAVVLRAGVKNLTDVDLEDKSDNFVTRELGRNLFVSATYRF